MQALIRDNIIVKGIQEHISQEFVAAFKISTIISMLSSFVHVFGANILMSITNIQVKIQASNIRIQSRNS
jgi:hypothetical protein